MGMAREPSIYSKQKRPIVKINPSCNKYVQALCTLLWLRVCLSVYLFVSLSLYGSLAQTNTLPLFSFKQCLSSTLPFDDIFFEQKKFFDIFCDKRFQMIFSFPILLAPLHWCRYRRIGVLFHMGNRAIRWQV